MSRILLVEDNELNRDMLTRRLNRAGLDVIPAGDGKAGKLYQLALVKGKIDPFTGDFRAALNMVRSFAETSRAWWRGA